MQEVFDPFMAQTNDQNEYKTLNEIKEGVQDSTLNQNEKKVMCEIEDRVANANGRFPCRYCNQTLSKSIYAMSHEKKLCKKRKSNKNEVEDIVDIIILPSIGKGKLDMII